MTIFDRILSQKEEIPARTAEASVRRRTAIREMGSGIIKVITGPRRCGKSSLAFQALKGTKFGYANFDDEQLVRTADYDYITKAILRAYSGPKTLFLDEIQNLERWELFASRLQRQGFDLVITGSNSNLLSQELATRLTGRYSQTCIFPFSYGEYCEAVGAETPADRESAFSAFLRNGGYPEPAVKRLDPREYLSTLADSVLYKDVVRRYHLRKAERLDSFLEVLLSSAAREYSVPGLARRFSLTNTTAGKYVSFLQEACLVFSVPAFSFSAKERAAKNRKVFCVDNGLLLSRCGASPFGTGQLLENAVGVSLYGLVQNDPLKRLYYWKGSKSEEVDFLVMEGAEAKALIQVCADPSDEKTKRRETRALVNASRRLKCNNLLVVTMEGEAREEIVEWFGTRRSVRFVRAAEWLEGMRI
jgi:predicted AAA+ superfamily ATPase